MFRSLLYIRNEEIKKRKMLEGKEKTYKKVIAKKDIKYKKEPKEPKEKASSTKSRYSNVFGDDDDY